MPTGHPIGGRRRHAPRKEKKRPGARVERSEWKAKTLSLDERGRSKAQDTIIRYPGHNYIRHSLLLDERGMSKDRIIW